MTATRLQRARINNEACVGSKLQDLPALRQQLEVGNLGLALASGTAH